MIDCKKIVKTERLIIDKYLGRPFKWAGDGKEGMDCWQLFRSIYADLGHEIQGIDQDAYPATYAQPHNHFIENFHREWDQVQTPAVFDAVLLFDSRRIPGHVGIVLANKRMIHCTRAGVNVVTLSDPAWAPKIQGYYRLRAMSQETAA